MYLQQEYIREGVAITRNDTFKLDLPDSGILSSLFLRIDGRVAVGNPMGELAAWRQLDYLDKFTILLDGATVCKAVSGMEAQYIGSLDQKVMPPQRDYESSQPYVSTFVILNFGRFIGDTDFALDLSRFDSVELQLKNSCPVAYFQDEMKVTILAYWMRELPGTPVGYIRSEEWRSWTTVLDETMYLDLPTAYPIRRVILQLIPAGDDTTHADKTSMFNLADDVEFLLKTGLVRLYKGGIDDLARHNLLTTGLAAEYMGETYHAANRGFRLGPGVCRAFADATSTGAAGAPAVISGCHDWQGKGTGQMKAYTADETMFWIAKGLALHYCVLFPFDHNPNPMYWLDPEAQKTVELNIHTRNAASAAGGTINVVLEQLVRY